GTVQKGRHELIPGLPEDGMQHRTQMDERMVIGIGKYPLGRCEARRSVLRFVVPALYGQPADGYRCRPAFRHGCRAYPGSVIGKERCERMLRGVDGPLLSRADDVAYVTA